MRRFESYLPSQVNAAGMPVAVLGSRQVVKTLGFDPSMRRFESYLPSHPFGSVQVLLHASSVLAAAVIANSATGCRIRLAATGPQC